MLCIIVSLYTMKASCTITISTDFQADLSWHQLKINENWLWKSDDGTLWQHLIHFIQKRNQFPLSVLIFGKENLADFYPSSKKINNQSKILQLAILKNSVFLVGHFRLFYASTNMKISQMFLDIKDGRNFLWLPWFPGTNSVHLTTISFSSPYLHEPSP